MLLEPLALRTANRGMKLAPNSPLEDQAEVLAYLSAVDERLRLCGLKRHAAGPEPQRVAGRVTGTPRPAVGVVALKGA